MFVNTPEEHKEAAEAFRMMLSSDSLAGGAIGGAILGTAIAGLAGAVVGGAIGAAIGCHVPSLVDSGRSGSKVDSRKARSQPPR